MFAGGTILYAAAKIYSRARFVVPKNGGAQATWTEAAGLEKGEPCDAAERIELVERLTLVGQPWCLDVLQAAQRIERDPSVRKAIKAALATLSR